MNALIHLDQNGKKVMERRVHEAVMKERADISTRAQYVWALSMLQCGLSPSTVQRVANHFEAVLDKYMEYQTEDLGDLFMRSIDSKGKTHKDADTPRYKALGNSIALPQWYYVLGGIADRLPEDATLGSLFDGIGGFPYVWAQLHAGRKELCVWASEIEEFPIAVTKKWFPEVEDGKLF